jgi:probable rRNA maturation factor
MAILIENRQTKLKIDLRQLRIIARKILSYLGLSESELSIVIVDNEQIREINKNYLGKDCPTNVVSFSMSEGEYGNVNPNILGDVIISVEKAHEDAVKSGISSNDEIDHLLIHGILHLIGYNHEKTTRTECRRMNNKSKELFLSLKGYDISD